MPRVRLHDRSWRCLHLPDDGGNGNRLKEKQMANVPKLLPAYISNFETLKKAVESGDLALLSAIRKSDQKPVALVCAMNRAENGDYCPVPIAVMCEGNPYEDFEDPTQLDVMERTLELQKKKGG
jgi:hypothetical protein